MSNDAPINNDALEGPIFPTFIRYMMPSLLGLIAMTSGSLVDGMFIGNYEGVTALAAVNLIIPITTLLFGVSMMISIGGSVRGGKYLGEKNTSAASAIFSKTLMFMVVYGLIVIALGLMFEAEIFASLGADKTLISGDERILSDHLPLSVLPVYCYPNIFLYSPGWLSQFSGLGTCHRCCGQYYPGLFVYCRLRLGTDGRSAGDGALRGSIPCGDAVLLFSPTAENIFWLAGKMIGARSFRRPTTVSLNLLMKCLAR